MTHAWAYTEVGNVTALQGTRTGNAEITLFIWPGDEERCCGCVGDLCCKHLEGTCPEEEYE